MTQIKIPVQWKVQMNTKDLGEYLLTKERLQPYAVDIAEAYAEYLEYGTGPAMNSSDGVLERNISIWVRRKAGADLSKAEQDKMIQRVLWSIRKYGLKERPFWRPSFYYMCDHMQEWFDNG